MTFLQFLKDVSVIIASCAAIYGINSWQPSLRSQSNMGAGILIDFAFNVGADTHRAAEALAGRKVKMILSAGSKNLKSFFHLCT